MKIFHQPLLFLFLFIINYSAAIVDERSTLLTFGRNFAKWCGELLNVDEGWSKLLPLFSRPTIFNDIPSALKPEFGESVEMALDALYGIRDRLVTEENIRNEIKQWKVVEINEEEAFFDDVSGSRSKENVQQMGGGSVGDLDFADFYGENKEIERQKARKIAEEGRKNGGEEKLFPFNPKHLSWEDKNKFGEMQDILGIKMELKTIVRLVAEYMLDRSKKVKGQNVDLAKIVEENGLMEGGGENKRQNNGRGKAGGKRKYKGGGGGGNGGTGKNYRTDELNEQFRAILANVKKVHNLHQDRNLDMPPSESVEEIERKMQQKGNVENTGEKEREKCIWIMRVLKAQEFNEIQQVESKLLAQYPELNKIYGSAKDVFVEQNGNNSNSEGKGKGGKNGGGRSPTRRRGRA